MSALHTTQLLRALKSNPLTRPAFADVVPADKAPLKVPPKNQRQRTYIINTHPSTKPGEHWVGLHFAPRGEVFYFDSYGSSNKGLLYRKLLKAFPQMRSWPRRLQGSDVTCGYYCACFVLGVAKHFNFDVFGRDLEANDRLVRKLTRKLFQWQRR